MPEEENQADYLKEHVWGTIAKERDTIMKLRSRTVRSVPEVWDALKGLVVHVGGTVLPLVQKLGGFVIEIRNYVMDLQTEFDERFEEIEGRLAELESGFGMSPEEMATLNTLLSSYDELAKRFLTGDELSAASELVAKGRLVIDGIPVVEEGGEEGHDDEDESEEDGDAEEQSPPEEETP